MSLAPGSHLGPYEVLAPLGAGGMGEVYRARDPKLGREVAVKILPADVAADPGRRARLEQEARSASALNHPNIIHIYDIGESGATLYLVMELVEGRTLRAVLEDGPLPLRRALEVGEQVAAGLARAHAAGIIHRDVKPENLMVGSEGLVKILDFGLAKQLAGDGALSGLPTAAGLATGPGIVMGTAAYMSPEQARGGTVGHASDQFALGLILHEMITGRHPFQRETPVQTLSAIIGDDPERLDRGAPRAPAPLQWILERCLAKDPEERYAATLDLARDLRALREHLLAAPTVGETGATDPGARRRSPGALAAVALAGLAAGLALAWLGGWIAPRSGPPPDPAKLTTLTFSGYDLQPSAAPDGRTLAFISNRDGRPRVWLRQVGGGSEVALTEGPDRSPRFSPDGGTILFSRLDGRVSSLYRVSALGGEPRRVVTDVWEGDWSPDGRQVAFVRIVSTDKGTASQVLMVPVEGGEPRLLGAIDNVALFSPRVSPDGRWVATSATNFGLSEGTSKYVALMPVAGGETRELQPAVEGGDISSVVWVSGGAEVVYAQGEAVTSVALGSTLVNLGASRIVRQRLDDGASTLLLWSPSLTGVMDLVAPGHLVMDGVNVRQNLSEHTLDAAGELSAILSQGTSIDRQPVYSPDGRILAFSSNRAGNLDIWVRVMGTGELRRLTDHPADDWDPAFTSDGRHLIFTSRRGGNFEIYMAHADGSEARQVTRDGVDAENATATPDGEWLVYNSGHPDHPGIWKIRSDGTEARRIVPGACQWPEISPDGRHVAYSITARAGQVDIRVARVEDGAVLPFRIELFTTEAARGRVRWLPDGRRLAFTAEDGEGRSAILVQDFDPEATDTSQTMRTLVRMEANVMAESFAVAPGGNRITVAGSERMWNLLTAENLAGLSP